MCYYAGIDSTTQRLSVKLCLKTGIAQAGVNLKTELLVLIPLP